MQQYACTFVLRHYLFLKAHSIPQASLSENCLHPGTGNPQTNICAYFCAKWRLLLDPSRQGCFWTLRCFYIYSRGVPRLFQNSDPLSTTRPTKVICLQRRNRRLYDRGSHSFVGSKSTFPCQRIVYVVIKRLHFRVFSDSVFSN